MAIVLDQSITVGAGVNNISASYTTGAGSNTMGLLFMFNTGSSTTVTSGPTWGGTSMNLITANFISSGNADKQFLYYLPGVSGTQTIAGTTSATVYWMATTYFNVAQTNSFETSIDGAGHNFIVLSGTASGGSDVALTGTANTSGETFVNMVNGSNSGFTANSPSVLIGPNGVYDNQGLSTGSQSISVHNPNAGNQGYASTMIGLIPFSLPASNTSFLLKMI